MATYRPSFQVTLDIRVEEFAQTQALDSRLRASAENCLPTYPAGGAPSRQNAGTGVSVRQQLENLSGQIRSVEKAGDDTFTADQRAIILRDMRAQRETLLNQLGTQTGGTEQTVQLRPPGIDGTPPDDRYVRAGILPRSVSIDRNSFRTADTAQFTLNWKDVPFDPRLIRAAVIEVQMGVVSADDYAGGIRGERGPLGQLRSVIEPGAANALPGSSTRFVGWVDTWTVKYDSSDGDSVMLECRDFTALFIDEPLSGRGIDLTLPLDQGISSFICTFPSVAGVQVVWDDGVPESLRSYIPASAVPPQRRARRGRSARQTRSGDQKMNLWDHITDVCVANNVVPVIDGTRLLLSNPRTLLSGDRTGIRNVIYGKNLSNLEFTRKLGGVKVPTIEVRCYDPSIGKTRWARHPVRPGETASGVFGDQNPPRPIRANEVSPTGAVPEERIQTVLVRSITDLAVLARIAQGVYESTGKQEIEGNFSTADMAAWDVPKNGPDLTATLLTLEAGDTVEIGVLAFNESRPEIARTSAAVLQALSRQARIEFLRSVGWSQRVAERFAELQDAAGFQTAFRVQNVRITMDAESGFELKCDFINYVSVREDAQETPTAPEPTARLARMRRDAQRATADPTLRAELDSLRETRTQAQLDREAGRISEGEAQRRIAAASARERVLYRPGN